MAIAELGWSWVHAAGAFAAVAGILAAFTISAIVFVLSSPPPDAKGEAEDAPKRQWYRLFYAFLVSLYSLVAAALLFADISGDLNDLGVRAAFTGTFGGTLMALAVVQLLLAIIWTGVAYAPQLPLAGAKVLFTVIAILAGLLALIDQGDYFTATSATQAFWLATYPVLGLSGLLLLVILPQGLGHVARVVSGRGASGASKQKDDVRRNGAMKRMEDIQNVALSAFATTVTLLVATVSVLRELGSADLIALYTPWVSAVAMAVLGGNLFLLTWGLPISLHTDAHPSRA